MPGQLGLQVLAHIFDFLNYTDYMVPADPSQNQQIKLPTFPMDQDAPEDLRSAAPFVRRLNHPVTAPPKHGKIHEKLWKLQGR